MALVKSPDNTPEWYEGSTPWIDLTPAARLHEAIEGYDEDTPIAETMHDAGFILTNPRYHETVAAVMGFAARNLDNSEMEDAVDWLKEGGYIESSTPPAAAD